MSRQDLMIDKEQEQIALKERKVEILRELQKTGIVDDAFGKISFMLDSMINLATANTEDLIDNAAYKQEPEVMSFMQK